MTWTPSPQSKCRCGSPRGEHPTASCTDFVYYRSPRPRRAQPKSRAIPIRARGLIEAQAALLPEPDFSDRPRTRGDCVSGPRPCPWVSCRHHLGIEVTPSGSIKLIRPDREPWELEQTCSLDVADAGEHTLDLVGRLTNVTRERIRQIEAAGLRMLRGRMPDQ